MQGRACEAPAAPGVLTDGKRGQWSFGPLVVALTCLIGLGLVWVFAMLVPGTRADDGVILGKFVALANPALDRLARFTVALVSPLLYIIWAALIVSAGLINARRERALAAALVLALAPLSCELLKPLLAHTRRVGGWTEPADSWPSGHSTAALALALCAVLVSSAGSRRLAAAAGALFAAAVGCALLILENHMPSDVLGGYLLAGFWTALALARPGTWQSSAISAALALRAAALLRIARRSGGRMFGEKPR